MNGTSPHAPASRPQGRFPALQLRHPGQWIGLWLGLLLGPGPVLGLSLFGHDSRIQTGLNDFPQWQRILQAAGQAPLPAALAGVAEAALQARLEAVNRHYNRVPYVADRDNYGVLDYWATPAEFVGNGGDCEDYAIAKFLALRRLGVDAGQMALVAVQDTNLRTPHAILVVRDGQGQQWVLDNQVTELVPAGNIHHYVPVYALGEQDWWFFQP